MTQNWVSQVLRSLGSMQNEDFGQFSIETNS